MAQDVYQSTNKLPDNPYPERSHLLIEGVIDIAPSSYIAYPGNSGFYVASEDFDLTRLIQLGNRNKGFPPVSLEAKVWLDSLVSGGGQIDDHYKPLPILVMGGYTSLSITQHTVFELHSVYIIADDVSSMYLNIQDVRNAVPGRTQSFSYKVYNTTYEYTDTL